MARQAPLPMGVSRQQHWSGLPCPPPGDRPLSGIKPASLRSPALAGRFFTTSATWEALTLPRVSRWPYFVFCVEEITWEIFPSRPLTSAHGFPPALTLSLLPFSTTSSPSAAQAHLQKRSLHPPAPDPPLSSPSQPVSSNKSYVPHHCIMYSRSAFSVFINYIYTEFKELLNTPWKKSYDQPR